MSEVFYQRGANGRIAERQCAFDLVRRLEATNLHCATDLAVLEQARDQAVDQFRRDLSPAQIDRALAQGTALGHYLCTALAELPELLGLPGRGIDPRTAAIDVVPVGNNTGSGSSADVLLTFTQAGSPVKNVAISLKAYRGDASSLGSKGALPSLDRLFGRPGEQITALLGAPALQLEQLLADYKLVARQFYDVSAEGQAFVDAYEARKGTRRVSNPLRRRELGDYFAELRGFKSEHRFAQLFVDAYRVGLTQLSDSAARDKFYDGMRFLLGMERDVIVLNAVADDSGDVRKITNSLTDTKYGRINHLLDVGCTVELTSRPRSGGIGVVLYRGATESRDLRLAMWKDATIQFQLVGVREESGVS